MHLWTCYSSTFKRRHVNCIFNVAIRYLTENVVEMRWYANAKRNRNKLRIDSWTPCSLLYEDHIRIPQRFSQLVTILQWRWHLLGFVFVSPAEIVLFSFFITVPYVRQTNFNQWRCRCHYSLNQSQVAMTYQWWIQHLIAPWGDVWITGSLQPGISNSRHVIAPCESVG